MSNLRKFRLRAGLSVTQLACKTGILAQGTVSDFELGKRKPWPKAKKALAHALNVPEHELFPEVFEPAPSPTWVPSADSKENAG